MMMTTTTTLMMMVVMMMMMMLLLMMMMISITIIKEYEVTAIHLNTGYSLQWRHNECDSVSNHQPHDCSFNRLFTRRSKKTSKLRVTDLCAGNSPVNCKFPAQMASNTKNVSILRGHHVYMKLVTRPAYCTGYCGTLSVMPGYMLTSLCKSRLI